jgi:mono/diheme cytochrome c family protein
LTTVFAAEEVMSRLVLLTSFLTLVFILPIYAEESHTDGEQGESQGERKITDTKLSGDVLKFLEDHTSLPEEYLKYKLEPALPNAIEKALKKDETEISQIVAFLMGRLNKEQRKKLEASAQAEVKKETTEKEPEKRDDRKVLLMKRLLWGIKAAGGSPTDKEEAQAFNKEFKDDYKDVLAQNEEILEKLKQAADGNNEARKWVRENLSQKAILGFAEGQRKTGNKELADRIVEAYSFNIGKQKFLDLHGHDGEPQRMYLGDSKESVSKAVDGLFQSNASKPQGKPGFGAARVALTEFQTEPAKKWHIDAEGKFKKGTPPGVTPPQPPPPSKPVVPARDAVAEGRKVFDTSCMNCHAQGKGGMFEADIRRKDSVEAVQNHRMPKVVASGVDPLSAQQRTDLLAYLNSL